VLCVIYTAIPVAFASAKADQGNGGKAEILKRFELRILQRKHGSLVPKHPPKAPSGYWAL
jgi:hypothetical protein